MTTNKLDRFGQEIQVGDVVDAHNLAVVGYNAAGNLVVRSDGEAPLTVVPPNFCTRHSAGECSETAGGESSGPLGPEAVTPPKSAEGGLGNT